MPETSNKGGRKPRVTDEDLLDVFRTTTDPVLSTAEVSDRVPIKRRGTLNRLRALEEQGELESKQIGGRNTVWWLVEDPGSEETPREARDAPESAPEDRGDTTPQEDVQPEHTDIRAAVEELDLEGSGTTLEAREDALVEIVETLREEGSATAGELKALVDAEAVGYKNADSFWTNMRSQNVFDPLPVETPGRGGRRYRYTEP